MQNGNCPFDKQCNYAHGPMELRSYPMSRSMHPSQMHYSDPIPRRKESDIYHPKYKTSLCASVINGTECTKGTLHLFLNFQVQNSMKNAKLIFRRSLFFRAFSRGITNTGRRWSAKYGNVRDPTILRFARDGRKIQIQSDDVFRFHGTGLLSKRRTLYFCPFEKTAIRGPS